MESVHQSSHVIIFNSILRVPNLLLSSKDRPKIYSYLSSSILILKSPGSTSVFLIKSLSNKPVSFELIEYNFVFNISKEEAFKSTDYVISFISSKMQYTVSERLSDFFLNNSRTISEKVGDCCTT